MPNKAPANWEERFLKDVCEIGAGNSAPQEQELYENGNYYFIRTSDVGFIHFGEIRASKDKLNQKGIKGLKLYKKGTILLPKSGASTFLNHRVIMCVDAYVVSHLATIKANNSIFLDKFLLYFLSTIDAKSLIQNQSYPSLRLTDISNIKVKIPPLSEQERIVRILDEVFENIEKAKQNTLKNLNNAKELFESHLNTLLCYFEINGKYKHLSELTTVKDGTHESPKYVKIGIPFITQKNIKDNGLVFITQDTKYISEEDHSKFYQRSNVEQGDILISMIGANRGMACLVDIKNIFSIKNVGLIKFNSNINMKYLLYFLKSKFAKKYIDTKSKGGAQEFISLTSLRNFPILYVDIKDQEYIVQQLDRTKENIQKLEQIYNQKLKSLEELKQTILQKAFNGEL